MEILKKEYSLSVGCSSHGYTSSTGNYHFVGQSQGLVKEILPVAEIIKLCIEDADTATERLRAFKDDGTFGY
jgi:hypothetical protein